MADIRYKYAYDENKEIVCINDYTKEEASFHSFTCIDCGNPISPWAVESIHRRAHFHHKEIVDCEGDKYLHTLAELRMKERFENSTSFKISYSHAGRCSEKSCIYHELQCNNIKEEKEIELKEYYDTCEIEKEVTHNGHRFIADLLLTNSRDASTPPLLIEIYVTHQCEYEKTHSGLHIIEIKIESEEDIEKISTTKVFSNKQGNISLYGFRSIDKKAVVDISRYVHFPDKGGCFVKVPCDNARDEYSDETDLEANITYPRDNGYWGNVDYYHEELANYLSVKFHICECIRCKNWQHWDAREMYCTKLKYGEPKPVDLSTCFERAEMQIDKTIIEKCYKFDFIKNKLKGREEYRVVIASSRNFSNERYAIEKCSHLLDNKRRDKNLIVVAAIISSGNPCGYTLADAYAKSYGLALETHVADWDRNGKAAAYRLYDKVLANANALVYFWNGKNDDPNRNIVNEAKKYRVPFRVVDFSKENEMCPECGGQLVVRRGPHGFFMGCMMYPDCKGSKEMTSEQLAEYKKFEELDNRLQLSQNR